MAKFQDSSGNVIEVANPDMNPQLVEGMTEVADTTPLGENTTITSSDLSDNTPPLDLVSSDEVNATLGGASVGADVVTNAKDSLLAGQQQQQDLEENFSDINTQIQETIATLGTQSQRRQQLEQEAGIPEQNKRLQNVINELQTLEKEALAIPISIQEEFAGRGVTAGGVEPVTASRLRKNAIKALSLSAVGQTLQGNINLAQNAIQRALDAEFEPERVKLDILQQQYQYNKDSLDRIDRKQSERTAILLAERNRILETKREDKKASMELALSATRYGAPQSVIDQMVATTPDRAMSLGAEYLGQEWKQQMEQIAFNQGIQTRQLAIQEAQLELQQQQIAREQAKEAEAETTTAEAEIDSLENMRDTLTADNVYLNNALENVIGRQHSTGRLQGIASRILDPASSIPLIAGSIPVPISTAVGYDWEKQSDYLADMDYILKNMQFEKIGELNEMGVKLAPVSDTEFRAMGESAGILSTSAIRDDETGKLLGFKLSDERVAELTRDLYEHRQAGIAELNVQIEMMEDDLAEIKEI